MRTHDFSVSLSESAAQADEKWWELVYRQAFPAFAGMTRVVGDCPAQRDGVDRMVMTTNGHVFRVEEKLRKQHWDDFCLEYWSAAPSPGRPATPGWMAKDLGADFLAYAIPSLARCYMLPFPLLRRAWIQHSRDWIRLAGQRRDGFRIVKAMNGGYTTECVAVPTDHLFDALRGAMLVRWE